MDGVLMKEFNLKELQNAVNIVDLYDDADKCDIADIGQQVIKGYEIDETSREEWKEQIDEALKMDRQLKENKTFPWPGAADIKFPLITEAAIDFAAATSPALIQNNQVVRCEAIGKDPDGTKFLRAERVSTYLSYQLVHDSSDWVDNLDQLLQMIPIMGTVFRKLYYSPIEKKCCFELCSPYRVVVNYNARSLDAARRITHIIQLYKNDVIERQRKGLYCDEIDVELLTASMGEAVGDQDAPLTILEQHCWLDLDGDGYKEPYIVTVHKESGEVLRIYNRFSKIEKDKKGEVSRILPKKYFVDYHCIRSSDGGFYSRGYGALLLPTNKAINSTFNQLIDSGTLNNTQGGFIGKGLRIKNGSVDLSMGEWKVLDVASGTDIKSNVFPMPTKEPSATLFNLLDLLIKTGKDLAQSTDVMQGNQPAQNVAMGTVNTLLEQGSKVPTDIKKRLYRSLQKEYQLLYELNSEYPDAEHYKKVLDDEAADYKADFELGSLDIYPVGDPLLSSASQRVLKAQMLQTLPTLDKRAVDLYVLQTMQIEDSQIKLLAPQPDPHAPPPPEAQKIMAETNLASTKAQQIQLETTIATNAAAVKQQESLLNMEWTKKQMQESDARQFKMLKDAAHGDAKVAIAGGKMQNQASANELELQHKKQMDIENLQLAAMGEANKTNKVNKDADNRVMDNMTKLEIAKLNQKKDDTND